MARFSNVLEAIGNTPLVKLTRLSPAGSEVYVKLEGKNPGGSVKDRPALSMIDYAEASGKLQAGGTIIEPTSGNMGIAIAMISAVRGYRAILVMPDTMTKERIAYMSAYGAEIVLTPGKLGMKGTLDKTQELLQTIPGSITLGQFENPANIAAHRAGTGPEILRDLPDVDYVVAGFGTGGTISGIAYALRDAGSKAVPIAVEPAESPLITGGKAGPHKIQGIGANFVPRNLDRSVVKTIVPVKGEDAQKMARELARQEGIFAGVSSGGNVWEAIEVAKAHPGSKVVAILPDGGDKYISTGIYDRGRGDTMPISVPDELPAADVLEGENIFVMREHRAKTQDIRPLKILILNLMPTKVETEIQLMRLLSNSPLQTNITLLQMASHVSKNTSQEYLDRFYDRFDNVKGQKWDGLIITGAPVENIDFDEVDYWDELCEIMEWSKTNVFSVMHICWGAQAGLYYHYGIRKYPLQQKMSGVFAHRKLVNDDPLLRGCDDVFWFPHSRHTEVRAEDISRNPHLHIIASSEEAGVGIVVSERHGQVFILGHMEYDANTLSYEYYRDLGKGMNPHIPAHYFPNDDPANDPVVNWRSTANLVFTNWLNYYVYQRTPYDIEQIGREEQ